jgi:hypothetical protein
MDLTASVHKMFRVATVTGALLVLACLQAGPANSASSQLFTEKWQQKLQCTGGGSSKTCKTVGGGNFTIEHTFPGTCLVPSDLDMGSGDFVDISLGDGTLGLGSDSTEGLEFDESVDNFKLQVLKDRTIATFRASVKVCKPSSTNCKDFNFEKVKVTINSDGDLTVSVSATTGFDFNGDFFEVSLDAMNFVGMPSGDITDTMNFAVDMGCFDSGDLPVDVTGRVKTVTKSGTNHGLSTVKIKGIL